MVFLVALGFIGNSYESYARSRGWPVIERVASWAVGSIIMVPISIGIVWYHEGWAAALVALVGGFALALLLTNVLRQYVQVLWVVSMIAVVAWVIIATAARLVG